jgi:E3 ubiquitin-protein ligase Topors
VFSIVRLIITACFVLRRRSTRAAHPPIQSAPHKLTLLVDEAEGFLLQHALVSPPRTWPPLPPNQKDRLAATRKKMDWDGEVRSHPDEPVDSEYYTKLGSGSGSGSGSGAGNEDDANKERCVICLMALRDRTVVGVCGHEFCVST